MTDTEKSTRLIQFSRGLRVAASIATLGIIVATAAILAPFPLSAAVSAGVENAQSVMAVPVAVSISALVVFALLQLCVMLRRVELGDMFGAVAIAAFRRFAWALCAASAVSVVAPWIAGLGAVASGTARSASLSLDIQDALLILLSALLLLIARLLEAAALYELDSRSVL